jgi:hypothetical protein
VHPRKIKTPTCHTGEDHESEAEKQKDRLDYGHAFLKNYLVGEDIEPRADCEYFPP